MFDDDNDDDCTPADLTHLSETDLALHECLSGILANETAILDPDDADNLALVIVEELPDWAKAAPALLEALAHLLGAAECDCMEHKSNVWRSYMIDARAAIAKATRELS